MSLQDVTPEAVEALLAEQEGVAWPIFVDGNTKQARKILEDVGWFVWVDFVWVGLIWYGLVWVSFVWVTVYVWVVLDGNDSGTRSLQFFSLFGMSQDRRRKPQILETFLK